MVVVRSYKRREGSTNYLDAAAVRTSDDSLRSKDSANQFVMLALRNLAFASKLANVVDPLKSDKVAHSGLRDYILIKSCQGTWPQAIRKKMVPANSLIENSDIACGRVCIQALGENICPSIVAVGRSAVPIGNRVTEHHHSSFMPMLSARIVWLLQEKC